MALSSSDRSMDNTLPYLFTSLNGAPISFHVQITLNLELSDVELIRDQLHYGKLIKKNGGRWVEDYEDTTERTILLADEGSYKMAFDRPCFKIKYLTDCINEGKLLDLRQYIHPKCPLGRKSHDYFEIIWQEKKSFKKANKRLLYNPRQIVVNVRRVNRTDSSCRAKVNSADEDRIREKDKPENSNGEESPRSNAITSTSTVVAERPRQETSDETQLNLDDWGPRTCKSSRTRHGPYTLAEEVRMLKFIVRRGKLTGLRANPIWKSMEKSRICHPRTYQSLKNHFLKYLIYRLDQFDFLTERDKKLMKSPE